MEVPIVTGMSTESLAVKLKFLRGLLLSKFKKNRFFFYVKMFLSIIEILS